ncbi:hypothetical protein N9L68_07750 [bacterium]|nr:hypothetical protein [bacterium]
MCPECSAHVHTGCIEEHYIQTRGKPFDQCTRKGKDDHGDSAKFSDPMLEAAFMNYHRNKALGLAGNDRRVALEVLERLGLPPDEGSGNYDTAYWKHKCCHLHLDLNDEDAFAAKGIPNDGSDRYESFLCARSEAYWYGKFFDSDDPGLMIARGGQTKGVASASSDVSGASNARAVNSDDDRGPPAAARGFSDQALVLDGCCHRIRPYPWNPSYAPPPPSEALQAVGSSYSRPSSSRSRSPRSRRSRTSEMWSNALYEATREFMWGSTTGRGDSRMSLLPARQMAPTR